ncbi:oxidoreductase [Streptococcus caviae]|uniref:NAD(P)/FAD-dependent oxidoreductase n=1 Tax=Streptococcus sp. 'caviae' TaxID=1915004 RepID=UPI00094B961D|nr:NAD(P)/FAD-dependent oxidoreductase [Streptococcus sp. 'caviae']OLN82743.1 hypothetical protein BMI76_07350 [Streptococcus sp. 'caviae']
MAFDYLFSSGKIGNCYTKNRIVMSPMGENMGNVDGSLSEQAFAYYLERAKGGAGIIIPGVLSVDYPTGKTDGCQHRLDDPKFVVGWYRLANAIHHEGALLIPQIHHAGAQTNHITAEGRTPVCVSDTDEIEHAFIRYYRSYGPQHELTTEEIKELVQKFIQSAIYAQSAQCDGVEIHAAHGYLVSQFLSPDTNKRTDEYGGLLENRMRFLVEVIRGIRKACGPNFIIGARIPGKEWTKNGLTPEECLEIARTCEKEGCQFLDISGGTTVLSSTLMETQGYEQGDRVPLAEAIKKVVNIPVFTVGNLREPEFCNKVIKDEKADYICLGRSLLADPYWPKKAESGRTDEIRQCISCFDGCFANIWSFKPCGCAVNPNAGFERDFSENDRTESPKKVVIIGGGPAGMQAAVTAARLGHTPILIEKDDKLGGQLNIACVPPRKYPIKYETENLKKALKRYNVDVRLGLEATPEIIQDFGADAVIAATGSLPAVPPIKGVENTVQSWDILSGKAALPKDQNVIMIGGGVVACETAHMIAKEGKCKVTILEMLPTIANGLEATHLGDLMAEFAELKVEAITNAKVLEIHPGEVTYSVGDEIKTIPCDTSVLATGQRSEGNQLIEALRAKGTRVITAGDVIRPRKIMDAVREGNFAAYQL